MSKKNKLEKVVKFAPIKYPEGKRFVPYCSMGWHMGIPRDQYVCEQRKCNHYQRLYLK
jgi:hypothetical protein